MQKDSCLLCQIITNKIPSKKIYEDETLIAILDINGANPGHCFVIPKQHYPIIEQVPDREIGKIFNTANKLSTAIFETLNVQGTNILVANGIPAGQTVAHFMVNVIPRTENDGINLQWEPKKIEEEEMSTIELKLKEQTKNIILHKEPKPEPSITHHPKNSISEDEDSFSKQITRIP